MSNADAYAAEVAQRKLAAHLALREQLLQYFQSVAGGDFLAGHYLYYAFISMSLRPCVAVSLCSFSDVTRARKLLVDLLSHDDLETSVLEVGDAQLALPPTAFQQLISEFEHDAAAAAAAAAAASSATHSTRKAVVLASDQFVPLFIEASPSMPHRAALASTSLPSSHSSTTRVRFDVADKERGDDDELHICDDDAGDGSNDADAPPTAPQSGYDEHYAREDAQCANSLENLAYLSRRFDALGAAASAADGAQGATDAVAATEAPPNFALFALHRYNALPGCALSVPVQPDATAAARLRASLNAASNNRVVLERLAFDACGHVDACAKHDVAVCLHDVGADGSGAKVSARLDALLAALDRDAPMDEVCAADFVFATTTSATATATSVAAPAATATAARAARAHATFGLVRLVAASRALGVLAADNATAWELVRRLETDRRARWRRCRPMATNRNGVVFTPAHLAVLLEQQTGVVGGSGATSGGGGDGDGETDGDEHAAIENMLRALKRGVDADADAEGEGEDSGNGENGDGDRDDAMCGLK